MKLITSKYKWLIYPYKIRKKGFTLVELLAVIAILAIIFAIAVPGISNIIKSSKAKTFENNAKMVIKAIDLKKM